MCGRFALHNFYVGRVADEYPDVQPRRWDDEEQFHPRYNVAPQTNVPVIMQQPNGQGHQDLIVQTMKWGFQAKWQDASAKSPINARSEVILQGTANMWNSVRGTKHCIVVCEGYYEWLKKGTTRAPHYVKHPQGHLLLLAGLYEAAKSPGTYTCTILTTEANAQLAFLHERMPVILSGAQALEWLDVSKGWRPEVLEELRKPYTEPLVCYEVPAGVGKVGNEDPAFVEPISDRKDGLKAVVGRMAQKSKPTEKTPPNKPLKQEPTEILSDDSDVVEDPRPKAEPKSSPIRSAKRGPKSEPEQLVLDDSDVEMDNTRPKVEPTSSPLKPSGTRKPARRAPVKRGSSPIEIDISSGSESEERAQKKRKVVERQSSSSNKKRPTRSPGKRTITDFFGKK